MSNDRPQDFSRTTWHTMPADQGQIVHRMWAAAGQHGAICRTIDRSDGAESFRLHRWLRAGEFGPQNGSTGAARTGRRITADEARQLLDD